MQVQEQTLHGLPDASNDIGDCMRRGAIRRLRRFANCLARAIVVGACDASRLQVNERVAHLDHALGEVRHVPHAWRALASGAVGLARLIRQASASRAVLQASDTQASYLFGPSLPGMQSRDRRT